MTSPPAASTRAAKSAAAKPPVAVGAFLGVVGALDDLAADAG
ncbi:hypothetical protein ACWGJ2_33020 [Streptomyces sp. NPDC054796]